MTQLIRPWIKLLFHVLCKAKVKAPVSPACCVSCSIWCVSAGRLATTGPRERATKQQEGSDPHPEEAPPSHQSVRTAGQPPEVRPQDEAGNRDISQVCLPQTEQQEGPYPPPRPCQPHSRPICAILWNVSPIFCYSRSHCLWRKIFWNMGIFVLFAIKGRNTKISYFEGKYFEMCEFSFYLPSKVEILKFPILRENSLKCVEFLFICHQR